MSNIMKKYTDKIMYFYHSFLLGKIKITQKYVKNCKFSQFRKL